MNNVFLNLSIVLIFSLFVWFFSTWIWNRRRLYYYASKVQGPPGIPLIGSAHIFLGGTQNILEKGMDLVATYQPLFKIWLGPRLFFVVTRPRDIEVVLTKALEKDTNYDFLVPIFGNGLLTLPVNDWRKHRKVINLMFNQQILNSFIDIFQHYSSIFVKNLAQSLNGDYIDMFPVLTQCTMDIVCDTTLGIKVNAMKERSQYILWTSRASELGIMRLFNIFLHPNFIWKMTPMYKETEAISEKIHKHLKKIISTKRQERLNDEPNSGQGKKIFLDYLLELSKDGAWSDEELIEESRTIVVAGSDATALEVGYVLMLLGMHPDVQRRVYDEISSVLDATKNVTVDDLQQLSYLERVIKETLRLFPVGAAIARFLTNDIVLGDDVILPKGSSVSVPILHVHRDPELWKDPLKFNPDRFLPDEVSKRHPYSYLPFSGVSRNCIGFRYAMMALKTILVTILRSYEVVDSAHKSVDEVKLKFDVATKCVGGQRVLLKRRL